MAETPRQLNNPDATADLPIVEDAVLADMSGVNRLSQKTLWDNVGDTRNSALGAWALGEARHAERIGKTPSDAFLLGVGYAITAIKRQLRRNNYRDELDALEASFAAENMPIPE